jgi:hypothetical protein
LHLKLHDLPSHDGIELSGTSHGLQEVPHESVDVFETHLPPQSCEPVLQTIPQTPASQVAMPRAASLQRLPQMPQLFGFVDKSTQLLSQLDSANGGQTAAHS